MTDRFLHHAWNALVLGLIVAIGAGALALIYLALLRLVAKRLDLGLAPLIAGLILSGAAYVIARYRDDLVDGV
jgi:hypothetical protein